MAAEYRLRPRAQRDLEEIWDYTAARWSVSQAEKYLITVLNACAAIASQPRLGAPIDFVKPGYRRRYVGAHVVFYKATSFGVDIIRILHQSMDVAGAFGSDEA